MNDQQNENSTAGGQSALSGLVGRINQYIDQLAPHAKEREGGKLLLEAEKALSEKWIPANEAEEYTPYIGFWLPQRADDGQRCDRDSYEAVWRIDCGWVTPRCICNDYPPDYVMRLPSPPGVVRSSIDYHNAEPNEKAQATATAPREHD